MILAGGDVAQTVRAIGDVITDAKQSEPEEALTLVVIAVALLAAAFALVMLWKRATR